MMLRTGDVMGAKTTITADWLRPRPVDPAVMLGAVLVAVLAGAVVVMSPPLAVGGVVAAALAAGVVAHPPLAGYLLFGVIPLVAGVERGNIVPILRPSEVLVVFLGATLAATASIRYLADRPRRMSWRPLDAPLIVFVVAGSAFPLLGMVARGRVVTQGDLLYALVLVKYGAVYLIVRSVVRTETEVRRCLWLSMGAAVIVAAVGLLQMLHVPGVLRFLARYYFEEEVGLSLESRRATSTIGQGLGYADFMIFNLAIAAAWLGHGHARLDRHRRLLAGLVGLFALAGLASGQISAVLGLLVAAGVLGVVTGRWRAALVGLAPLLLLAAVFLQPVIAERLGGVDALTGVPQSWVARRDNLEKYFLPHITSPSNLVLGVRPEARVPAPETLAARWVYIESGVVWLLWTGGVPMLVAFLAFVWLALRETRRAARARHDPGGVAAMAAFTAVVVVAVLTPFDPHITLRGTADLLFPLLAVTLPAVARPPSDEASR